MRFSQRIGKTEKQETIQKDSMSESFRNRLISAVYFTIRQFFTSYISDKFNREYVDYFGFPYEEFSMFSFEQNVKKMAGAEDGVYFLYDLIEFLIGYCGHNINEKLQLIDKFNQIFELEKSAYRLDKSGNLIPITDEIELAELAKASASSQPYSGVYEHLEKAKMFFSHRENPDYKKTIAESVHAIESLCKIILKDDKATLGQAVKKLKLHKSLEQSISKLYGFASDGDGIRHANNSSATDIVDEHDARLILVSSHSIVNYLISKKIR